MRKKNVKRIGPVPITLVAVFALAAVMSVGLWLTANGDAVQAQGMPGGTLSPDPKKCEVIIHDDAGDFASTGELTGGGCFASGDSVDVVFKNTHPNAAQDKSIAVYVTGGDDFSGLQATELDGGALKSIGAEGIDEHLLTVDAVEEGFGDGQTTPGTQTVTVSRDMAKDGEVYVFVYLASLLTKSFETADLGIPISVLAKSGTTLNNVQIAAINTTGTADDEVVGLANAAAGEARTQDPDPDSETIGPLFSADAVLGDEDYLATIVGNDDPGAASDDDADSLKDARVALAQDNIDDARELIAEIKDADDYDNPLRSPVHDAVADTEVAIMRAQSAVDAIEGADPSYFLSAPADILVKVNFREVAVEAKKMGSMYVPFENTKMGSTIYVGRQSDTPFIGNTEIRLGADEATVTVEINDSYGVALAGFVDFSIDTSAQSAGDAVFTDSSRSSHYEELENGIATVTIQDLPETDPLKIPVTANFNSGELELTGYIVRQGDAVMVEAAAYVCEPDDFDPVTINDAGTSGANEAGDDFEEILLADLCDTEIKALKNAKTSDDPDEVVALGPEDVFFIRAKATDGVANSVGSGNTLSWELTAGADNIDDAERAIPAGEGDSEESILVASGSDAVPGTYSLTVTSPDGEADTMVMVTVSDVASMISVTCVPEMIPTTSGLTDCAVMVTDADGNVPSNLHEKRKADGTGADMVRVAVRSTDVTIIGVDTSNDTDLDNEGMASFSILLREDALEGSSITVNVSSTIEVEALRANTTVLYGEAAPEPMAMPEAGMAMDLMATATDDGSIMLDWTAGMDANWHFLRGDEVGGDEAVVWTFTSASDSHMVPADMLTSGTEYSFIVIAGYFVKNDAGGWDGGWSAGWTTAAMDTAMDTAMAGN